MSLLKLVVVVCVVLYLCGGAYLYFFQRSFIYFPVPTHNPEGAQQVELTCNNTRLTGFTANSDGDAVLLYFGGNAESVGHSVAELGRELPDVHIVAYAYRGYAGSEGQPTEEHLYADALCQYDHYAEQSKQIVVMGRSLGSGVATWVASRRAPDQLVLVTPFDSVAAMAARQYWFYPVRWMLKDKFLSAERAQTLTMPKLVITAGQDRVVPAQHSQALLSVLPDPVGHETFDRAEHNNVDEQQGYYRAIREFMGHK